MYRRCCSTADKQRRIHASRAHILANFLHLVQGRSDQSADCNKVCTNLLSLVKNGLLVYHHSKILYIESIASQYNTSNILADVVYISLYGGEYNFRL